MTAEVFDRLLYTDCRAGTGRGAGGGFQVQAQSSGVDQAQSRLAVGWLLYEVQNAWIVAGRVVADFPLGFAHACAEGYGTAQSCYVGQEATGGRPGNHLADCLLTRDPDRYGPTRPAQLWRSGLWRAEPWDSTDCPPLDGDPPLGPLTVDRIAEWLRERPERATILERLLSVLEEPTGQRVVMVADSPDEALAWIAAATLLLPVRQALEVPFKVFCVNPLRCEQRILAVPRELNPQVAPGRGDSAFVLDAEGCISDDAAVSDRARFLVGQLSAADDPYDVVDAVELAESLGGQGKPGGVDAVRTAWAVTEPTSSLTDPDALVRWMSNADPQLLRDHGTPVAARILDACPSAGALRRLDAAVADGLIDLDPVAVRGTLLSAEVAEVREGVAPPVAVLADVALDADARRDAESELSTAILLGSDLQVDLALRLAARHRVEPELAPLLGRLHEFVRRWLRDESADADPANWAHSAAILDMACDELEGMIGAGVIGVLRRLYPYLDPYLADRRDDPSDPLYCYLKAAAIATASEKERPAELSALLGQITGLPDHAAAVTGIQRVLLAWKAVGAEEAFAILAALPGPGTVEPEIGAIALRRLKDGVKVNQRLLDVVGHLDRHGLVPREGYLRRVLNSDRNVRALIEATRESKFMYDARHAKTKLALLTRADPAVVKLWLRPILEACLDCPLPDLEYLLLRTIPLEQHPRLLELWDEQLRDHRPVAAAVWGMGWVRDREVDPKNVRKIRDAMRKFGKERSPAKRERWYRDVQDRLPTDQLEAWGDISGHDPPKPRFSLRARDRETGRPS